MDLHPPHSFLRTKADIKDIEHLGDLINQLDLQQDNAVAEAFQRLVELAGSKEFLPTYSQIHNSIMNLKWAREGKWNTGYIVPWMNLYSSLGSNNQLVSIATHYTKGGYIREDETSRIFRSPLIKSPKNLFGNGYRPVEFNREDWMQVLQYGVPTKHRECNLSFMNMSRKRPVKSKLLWNPPRNVADDGVKSRVESPKKPVIVEDKDINMKLKANKLPKKRDQVKKKTVPFFKSKMIGSLVEIEKIDSNHLISSSTGHAAAAAGPSS